MIGQVTETCERLVPDAMRDGHTLFTTADGLKRRWVVSPPRLGGPPQVCSTALGIWGAIHPLVAPDAWRTPFERAWRGPNRLGD